MLPNQGSKGYANPKGAVMQVWHHNQWSSWMWEVESYLFTPHHATGRGAVRVPTSALSPHPAPAWCPSPPGPGWTVSTFHCVNEKRNCKSPDHCDCSTKQLKSAQCGAGVSMQGCVAAASVACTADPRCHSFALASGNCTSPPNRWETYPLGTGAAVPNVDWVAYTRHAPPSPAPSPRPHPPTPSPRPHPPSPHPAPRAGSGYFHFGRGGTQGSRPEEDHGSFYIENVLEELDEPGEW